jgi:hypothetical protein
LKERLQHAEDEKEVSNQALSKYKVILLNALNVLGEKTNHGSDACDFV